MLRIGPIFDSIRKRFYDNFAARADTTGSLGTATDGSKWTAINGTIQVTTGAAKSTTIPATNDIGTNYPMSVVSMPTQNARIELQGTNEGSSIAIWVQSSSDWWMVDVDATQISNANYANTQSWSYNYSYSYSTASAWNSAYNYVSTYYATNPSYTTSDFTGNYYLTTSGAKTYYVTIQGTTPYTSAGVAPFLSSTPYTAGTAPFSSATPYYRQGNTVNFTKGTTTYTKGATPYTAGATSYYAAGGTAYTMGTTTYFVVPPGTYQSGIPYTSSSYSQVYTSYSTGAPYATSTYSTTVAVASSQYWNTTGPNQGYTTAGNYYTYIAGYTTSYNEYVRIKQSVASTVSTMSSLLISTAQTIKSLLVMTSGNQITVRAFSDSALVTQLGSDLVYTATGATVTPKYGISVSPSPYNGSAIIGTSINITRN